jgi:long-subunit fatty acid transport protein
MLNIAIKYEGKTSLKFKNETASDFVTAVDPVTGQPTESMFPDGYEYNADMPAMLAFGASLKPIDKLMISAGATTYFDKGVDYSQGMDIELIDKNYLSYSFGAEYGLTDALKISAGYSGTSTGVNDLYQSDITHSLNTSTVGGGFQYSIGSLMDINVGAAFTSYAEESFDKVKAIPTGGQIDFIETYDRGVWMVAIGVDLHF